MDGAKWLQSWLKKKKMIRITWSFKENSEVCGHGEWFDESEEPMLLEWIKLLNDLHPNIEHRIEALPPE